MKKTESKGNVVLINLLIAVAISLVVNFSQFLFSIQGFQTGKGYHYHNPQLYLFIQAFYWFWIAFILLTIATHIGKRGTKHFYSKILYCVLVAAAAYLFCPTVSRESGNIVLLVSLPVIISPMVMLKASFTLIVTILYGKIYELLYQRHSIVLENEQLKNENLQTRYNMLVSQINPHFFFNSLNSLAMLVRGKHNDKALDYIDRLSDTFRYVIQSSQGDLTPLSQELEFLAGYKYLNEVRYADKLFIDIEVDPQYETWLLPVLSLQPLIENAVKHNSITLSKPFHITISTRDGELIVSNPIIPKIVPEEGTGIGLKNLSSRFMLLTDKDITIEQQDGTFAVRLPLTRPDKR